MPSYTAKVTSKGQITIPIEVRRTLKLDTGSPVTFDVGEQGDVSVRSPLQQLEAAFGQWELPVGMTVLDAIRLAREEMEQDAVDRYLRTTDR